MKQAKKHGFSAFRAKERQKKTRAESFAKFEKVKKTGFRALIAKTLEERCVQSFVKRNKQKNLDLGLLELQNVKKNTR